MSTSSRWAMTDDESLADHFTDPDTLDYANALRNWRI